MPRGALRVAAAALAGAVLAFGGTAFAQEDPLREAAQAYEEGRIAEAARRYHEALGRGGLEPAELVHVHLRLGILAALEGELDESDRRFAMALALDPIREPPEELSPELRERFEALRETQDGRRLTLVIRRTRRGDALRIEARHAPEGMAAAIRIRGHEGYAVELPYEGEPIVVEPPAGALPIEVTLFDSHGNRLARAGARLPVAVATDEPSEQLPTRTLLETPWLWVVVGAIVIGIGVTVGVSASGDRYFFEPPVIR